MKKTPLRRVSKRRAGELREYAKLRKEYLGEHATCEVCEHRKATDIHHKGTPGGVKRGSNLNNVDTWLAVCRTCHEEIEMNKSWARTKGYLA
jgi:hypothetical protein